MSRTHAATRRPIRRLAQQLASGLALLGLGAVAGPGCLDRPIEPIGPRTTTTLVERFTQSRVDKIDILLSIDDSGSMADKQAILALAVPDLIAALANPPCVADGQIVSQPEGPTAACPAGSRREFDPVIDIHVGIVTTSLGPRGSGIGEQCSDDASHLVHRGLELGATYDGLGFLAWDPAQTLEPPGTATMAELGAKLTAMVAGVGEQGCGYEAQLESWYRFLVEPAPYQTVVRQGQNAKPQGVDEQLLAQRRDFLRPDSLVAIVMLTDENDCSFRAGGQGWLTAENGADSGLYAKRARSECATAPESECCTPCGEEPASCPADPACTAPAAADHAKINLNCFAQKQRYGVDLLYSVDRYIAGLTQRQVPDEAGNLVDNPLFVGMRDGARNVRGEDLVFLAGIVGVPWQDIARPGADGRPDPRGGLKSAPEMAADGTWEVILGDPASGVAPRDPHMIQSIEPRSGQNPTTGDRIAPASATAPDADAINGHEYDAASTKNGDLQYACIFDLPTDAWRDCATAEAGAPCDCGNPEQEKKPLCQADDGSYSTIQRRAKAYPAVRQLSVLKGVGEQAIVASICPRQMADDQASDFGYRPAIGALTERLKQRLGDPCLARTFTPGEDGQVACIMLEGRSLAAGETCNCQGEARRAVSPDNAGAVAAASQDPLSVARGVGCFCEIPQLSGAGQQACQSEQSEPVEVGGEAVNGWCYVDATTVPPIGNSDLVAHCAASERRTIRFLGEGKVESGAILFLTCQQESQ